MTASGTTWNSEEFIEIIAFLKVAAAPILDGIVKYRLSSMVSTIIITLGIVLY